MELVLSREAVTSNPTRKLLDQVRDVMRLKHTKVYYLKIRLIKR
jgi:hypothetical protein